MKKEAAKKEEAKKEEEKDGEEGKKDDTKDEDKKDDKMEETKEEDKKEDEKEEEKEDEEDFDADLPVELTEEEQKIVFRKGELPDLSEKVFMQVYAGFGLPEKEEGFDSIDYEWEKASESSDFLRKYILEQKLSLKAEDLKPSDWFKGLHSKWQTFLSDLKKKANDWANPEKKKEILEKFKAELKEKGEENVPTINHDDLDAMAVEDIENIGDGTPLYVDFQYEDWTLLAARYELHLLLHAFKKDLNDPDRPTFKEAHLAYYYNKYYNKRFIIENFGVEGFGEFAELVKEVLAVTEKGFIEAQLPEDEAIANFVKQTEEHRRDRQRRVDAGDETALLKFVKERPARDNKAASGKDERNTDWRGDRKGDAKGGAKGDRKGDGKSRGKDDRSYSDRSYQDRSYSDRSYSDRGQDRGQSRHRTRAVAAVAATGLGSSLVRIHGRAAAGNFTFHTRSLPTQRMLA